MSMIFIEFAKEFDKVDLDETIGYLMKTSLDVETWYIISLQKTNNYLK